MIDQDTDWTLMDFTPPKKAEPTTVKTVPKGSCPKCGKHIGKGVRFHVMACDGHSGKA